MSQLIRQVQFLHQRRFLPSQGLSNSVRVIVNSNFQEFVKNPRTGFEIRRSTPPVSPSFVFSFNLRSCNHQHIARLLHDQFDRYHHLCDQFDLCDDLASKISLAAYNLGFGFNGFAMTLDVTVTAITFRRTVERSLSTLLQEGKIDAEELKSLDTEPCSICLENLSGPNHDAVTVTRMACSHLFHHHCLSEWLTCTNTCPMCRTVLSDQ